MTEQTNEPTASPAADAADAAATDAAHAPEGTANKAFWMGIGVGSAAVVAALMYARRPKRKK